MEDVMTPEEIAEAEAHNAELRLMFRTKGWALFVEELQSNYKTLDTLSLVDNTEELHYNKGQLAVLSNIINLEAILDANDKLMGEEADEAEPEPQVH